jgi:putative transposase
MKKTKEIQLEYGGFYHIYNRGNNGETLFYKSDNYYHFLRLYDKYIDPIAETFAWCLMGNHFHLLVRIKEEKEIGFLADFNPSRSDDSGRLKWKTSNNLPESEGSGSVMGMKKPIPHRMFGHLFNSYTKYLNLKTGRTGSLFEKNFHRIPIDSDKYFQNLVVYIHQNPVHHGFTDDFRDYPWSSYGSHISEKTTKLKRKEVLDWFDGRENFIQAHRNIVDEEFIEHLIKGL